jgi:hypothetical protein
MAFTRDPYSMQGQQVNEGRQALVQSESHSEVRHNSELGKSFVVDSGFILTGAVADTFSGIFFIENASPTLNIYLGIIRTFASAAVQFRSTKNPDSMSNNVTITPQNQNFSSGILLDAIVQAGSATAAITGGSPFASSLLPGGGAAALDLQGAIILGPGDSFSMEMAPRAAAAADVGVSIGLWQRDALI